MRGSIPKGRSGGGNSPSTLKPNWCWTFEADSDIDCWEKSDNDTPANGNILWLKIQLYGALWWRKVKDERFWFIDFTGWGQKKSLTTWIKHKKWFCGAPTTQDLHKKRFIYCKRREEIRKKQEIQILIGHSKIVSGHFTHDVFLWSPLVFRSNGSNCDCEMSYYAGLQSLVLILGAYKQLDSY